MEGNELPLSCPTLTTRPSYLELHARGEVARRALQLAGMYRDCRLCPRDCRVDRARGELGFCRASEEVKVSGAFAHFGEEPPLVGWNGSGTIFFSHCGLRCVYCQNHHLSFRGDGEYVTSRGLAEMMMGLQGAGCHNVNLVTPTHYLPGILAALDLAVPMGFRLPLVYNTSGYEKPQILEFLEGIIDIYMPDFKYWDPLEAARYSSGAYDYPEFARAALLEMHRQVEDLEVDGQGIARRGLIIRHLVLPGGVAGSREVLRFIAEEVSPGSYVNIMAQYRPEHEAFKHPVIARRITAEEFKEVLEWAKGVGIRTGLPGF